MAFHDERHEYTGEAERCNHPEREWQAGRDTPPEMSCPPQSGFIYTTGDLRQ
jgi:hypothetical protein